MKSLGARSGQVIKIYLMQTLLLGVLGGLLGVGFGVGVQLVLPLLLAKLINVVPDLHIDARSGVDGAWGGRADDASVYTAAAAGHPQRPADFDSAAGNG